MDTKMLRWTKDDKQNLRRAVDNFNRKIERLEKLGRENLPDKVSYKGMVGIGEANKENYNERIYTRRELNNIIRSLKRFTKKGAENLVNINDKTQITAWASNELRINQSRATRNIKRALNELKAKAESNFGMGEGEITALEATLRNIKTARSRTGTDFKRIVNIIGNNARSDTDMRRATIWRDNFKERMEVLSEFDNYDKLKTFVDTVENPMKLYEYLEQAPTLMDVFDWTDSPKSSKDKHNPSSRTYGGFATDQDAFNRGLEDLGLI